VASTRVQFKTDLGPVLNKALDRTAEKNLLTFDQECELGALVGRLVSAEAAADALEKNLGRTPTLEEWAKGAGMKSTEELGLVVRQGRWAKQELIVLNLRLVLSIAYKYQNRGTSVSDLVQEGVFALSRAAEKYDPARGYRFSTYATWWVRQRIVKHAVRPDRLSKVPEKIQSLARRAQASSTKLLLLLGRTPTEWELAADLGVTHKELALARGAVRSVYSVDCCAPNFGAKLASFSQYPSCDSLPETVVEAITLRESLEKVMENSLSDNERQILRMRCGLDDGRVRSLREIGETLHICNRKVWRDEQRALGKLRRTTIGVGLKAYLSSTPLTATTGSAH